MSRVLVVDDSSSARRALERILALRNLKVSVSDSAEYALNTLNGQPPDLIIANTSLPGMSGYQLCKTLKGELKYRHIPLLLVSKDVNRRVETHAHKVGAVGVLKHPFNPAAMLPRVDEALRATLPVTTSEKDAMTDLMKQTLIREALLDLPSAPQKPANPALGRALKPFLEKTDIESALVLTRRGECLLHDGQALPDEEALAAYFKLAASLFGVLGTKLDFGELETMLLEYQGKALLLARIDEETSLLLVLKDMSAGSLGRFLAKRQLSALQEALPVAASKAA